MPRVLRSPQDAVPVGWVPPAVPPPAPPAAGPGAELKRLLAGLGFRPAPDGGCGCEAMAARMDAWGVSGCRANRGEIEGWLREKAKAAGWLAFLAAAAKAVRSGLAVRLNLFDPVPGLVDEAIRRAETTPATVTVGPQIPPAEPPKPAPACLLVIGSFGLPGAVEYQLALAKKNLPGVPVLVSDDHTEQAWSATRNETPAHGAGRMARLRAACEKYGAVLVPSHPTLRCQHAGGDLAAAYNGLVHARDRGIPYVWKLSHRFFVDLAGWLPATLVAWERAERDTGQHLPLASWECHHTGHPPNPADLRFPVRTECYGLRVADWSGPEFLDPIRGHFRPRNLHGRAAEHVVADALAARGGGGMYGPGFFGPYRQHRYPGVRWHDSHSGPAGAAETRAAAVVLGVDLGPEFHADGQPVTPGYAGF